MKNSRTIKKELDRFAVLFEQQCKEGLVSTDKKTFAAYAEYSMTFSGISYYGLRRHLRGAGAEYRRGG